MEVLAKDAPVDNPESLSQHVRECINVANRIIPSLPLPASERQRLLDDVILALALHDVGKAATGFQDMLLKKRKDWGGRRHEILSASFASGIPSVSEAVIFSILTHHKSIPNLFVQSERKALNRETIPLGEYEQYAPWRNMKKEWYDNYASFRESWVQICELIGRNDLVDSKSLPGLRLDEAWLSRDEGPNGQIRTKPYDERRYFSLLRGLVMACDHMASGHYAPVLRTDGILEAGKAQVIARIQSTLTAFQASMEATKGSVLLRAPTGSGKTEAALLWAASNGDRYSRLYYVLPNIASINAMFQRLAKVYPKESVGLLHSRAREAIYRSLERGDDLESKLHDQRTSNMIYSLSHSIWYPVRVCTPHQVLRFSLRGHGWENMLAEFPNSTFVFDEIHAYEPRLVGQILATARLVSKWNAKCAFLSATMPSFLIHLIRNSLTDVVPNGETTLRFITPGPNSDSGILSRKRHYLVLDDGTLLDAVPQIINDMEKGLKVLVVCNTVRASQLVYAKVRQELRKGDSDNVDRLVLLIHSRFTREDRYDKEQVIMSDEKPKILIATQVVEVSLDISYDVGYFEPGPIDAIIQRMGRVNRSGKNAPAPIHVMNDEISKVSVYRNRERIQATLEELRRIAATNAPASEGDMVDVADHVYKEGFDSREKYDFESGLTNLELSSFESHVMAGASEDWKEEILSDSTGFDALPESLLQSYQSRLAKKLTIEAYGLLVPIHYWDLSRHDSYLLDYVRVVNWKYSRSIGLTTDAEDTVGDDLYDAIPSAPPNVL